MEIFNLHYLGNVKGNQQEQYSLAIGFFDGLHRGHYTVIDQAKKKAETLGIQSAVMTFDPHPSHLFGDGKNKVGYITTFKEKCRLLEMMGIDALFVVKFDRSLAALKPPEFIDIFIKKLGVKHVTAGFDFTFGSKGAGTMADMAKFSEGTFGTSTVGKVSDSEAKISSTRIRELLAKGDVKNASTLLGRNFRTVGTVVHGAKKGRQLGFPTANILPEEGTILPANGVYAVRFFSNGKAYTGVCNVGVKPTFNKPETKSAMVEVHVFDFDGDLYGQEVAVDWIEHIRKEKKFDSMDALAEQIEKDKNKAIEILSA